MSHIPARPLTPDELKTLKREKGLQRLTDAVEAEHAQRAQAPAKWFGRLLAVFVVAVLVFVVVVFVVVVLVVVVRVVLVTDVVVPVNVVVAAVVVVPTAAAVVVSPVTRK